MKRNFMLLLTLAILLIALFSVGVQKVQAQGTITIRADGSIDPVSAPITTSNNILYVFTGDVGYGWGIVVERDYILLDGAGYALTGLGTGNGIYMEERHGVILFNITIQGFGIGIRLSGCTYCSIIGNTVAFNEEDGILLEDSSSYNTMYGNIVQNNIDDGIDLHYADYNTIYGNNITDNEDDGIDLDEVSNYNTFHHNNFVNDRVADYTNTVNFWNTSYAEGGGNYWSDYLGSDESRGPLQDVSGPDEIIDTPRIFDENNKDNYPLMGRYILPQIDTPQILIPTRITLTSPVDRYCEGADVVIEGSVIQETDGTPLSGVPVTLTGVGHAPLTKVVITDSNGNYQYETNYTTLGDKEKTIIASWDGNTTHLGDRAEKKITILESNILGSCCFIATATYGSELAPEVQFLRDFRDNTVLTSFAGQQFIAVFNGIYYSFSPTVASGIARNEGLRTVMRGVLYPLISILQFGEGVNSLFTFSAELGIIAFCLVVSALLSLVYLAPWALLLSYWKRCVIPTKMIRLGSYLLVCSVAMLLIAVAVQSPLFTMLGGALTVLIMTGFTILVTTRIIMKRLITP